MAAITDDTLTVLLANIATELANATDLSELHNANLDPAEDAVAITFYPVMASEPFAVVVPTTDVKGEIENEGFSARQTVEIHVAVGILGPEGDARALLGTSAASGAIALCDAVEQALCDPSRNPRPYTGATYGASPYTSQNNVLGVRAVGWRTELQPDPRAPERTYVTKVLTVDYLIAKGV